MENQLNIRVSICWVPVYILVLAKSELGRGRGGEGRRKGRPTPTAEDWLGGRQSGLGAAAASGPMPNWTDQTCSGYLRAAAAAEATTVTEESTETHYVEKGFVSPSTAELSVSHRTLLCIAKQRTRNCRE